MLTAKQEAFVQNIIQGMSQADAYRSAYNASKMTDKTVHEKASLLASQDKVRARLTELREKLASEKIMSAQKRMEWLTEVIKSDEANYSDKLKAVDIMNKMDGEYVQKVQANVTYEDNLRKVVGEDEY
jgi:phage terminase small subunit